MIPSKGIFSPGFTCTNSPTATASGLTIFNPLSVTSRAVSGRTSINALIFFRDLSTA